ncbi:hypothetical protein O181_053844 [Austropuccinia psidii MF-1]|uniref:Uncharacterized protein n=1 Tax=Austropuccinia psidii MF-1 TaxID=1389203 RepID=A0A9Q3E3F8_9BASI|nr:hypothetical protein [Austropuccinia psidii MF-1]
MGRECLKEVPRLKEWPHFSVEGEYDHMELIRGIDLIQEDFELPERLVTAIFNTLINRSAHRWYIELKQAHGQKHWTWWKNNIFDNWANDSWRFAVENPLNMPELMLIKTKFYHVFANKKTDQQHYILTCQNL